MSSSPFRREHKIHFSECDPAGIVFYPQYFVMMNNLMETWFDDLGIGFEKLIMQRRIGVPSVRIEADFKAVSRMGDAVVLSLAVENMTRSTIVLTLRCESLEGELRMAMRQTLVTTSLETHRAIPVPEDLRSAIEGTTPSLAAAH